MTPIPEEETMPTEGHTETPWSVSGRYLFGPDLQDGDGDIVNRIIATVPDPKDAALIVRAVNAYQPLVEAARIGTSYIRSSMKMYESEVDRENLKIIEAALRLAESSENAEDAA